jgi:molybdenum cofactor cytidylyltransferase
MIAAVVLAAGLSRRMGTFKLLLPWRGSSTVISQVVLTLKVAGLTEIVVVTGHRAEEVAREVAATSARTVFNPHYVEGEMLSSIQAGLAALQVPSQCWNVGTAYPQPGEGLVDRNAGRAEVEAALLCLGDQPQIQVATVQAILAAGETSGWNRILVPSYHMHAGHPILLPRSLWAATLALPLGGTLHDVLNAHQELIEYVMVDTPSVLADLDTPADYDRER